MTANHSHTQKCQMSASCAYRDASQCPQRHRMYFGDEGKEGLTIKCHSGHMTITLLINARVSIAQINTIVLCKVYSKSYSTQNVGFWRV